MANVALFIFGVGELKGGGGAERFFADFFDEYQNFKITKHKLFYIIDPDSVKNLKEVNKLKSKTNLLNFKIYSNRIKDKLESLQLVKHILFKKIKIIHVPLYSVSYIPLLKKINNLPSFIRPKVIVNIVNCYVAPILSDSANEQYSALYNTYMPLFKEVKVDGYFCWNQSFVDYVNSQKVFRVWPQKIYTITSRFSDTKKFKAEKNKENLIVFASRLDEQKHADWFIKAIEILKNENELGNWKFIICGDGPLREGLIKYATEAKLKDVLEFRIEGEMQKVFNKSKIYISCQDYDNFPSLSMAEAMAAGNAIIARNVGQTNLFVKHGINGLLFDPDSPGGLAEAISMLISEPAVNFKMGNESIRLIKEIHNVPNFISQIDKFWSELLIVKN